MTIPSTPMSAGPFNTDGITTVFPFTYKSFGVGYHAVVKETGGTRTSLAYGTEFAVTQNADQNANPGGNVIISPAPAVGSTIEVYSNVPQEQPTQLPTGGRFNARVIMDALDRVVTLIKQGSGGGGALLPNDRSLRVPVGESINELGSAGSRAGKFMAFDAVGNAVSISKSVMELTPEGYLRLNGSVDGGVLSLKSATHGAYMATSAADNGFASLRLARTGGAFSGEAATFSQNATVVGSISVASSSTQYNTVSDYRLKNVSGDLAGSGVFIDALQPRMGTWKVDGAPFVGFVAHELQAVSPTSVTGVKDGANMQSVAYGSSEIIANMVAELKSLRARVAALEP